MIFAAPQQLTSEELWDGLSAAPAGVWAASLLSSTPWPGNPPRHDTTCVAVMVAHVCVCGLCEFVTVLKRSGWQRNHP